MHTRLQNFLPKVGVFDMHFWEPSGLPNMHSSTQNSLHDFEAFNLRFFGCKSKLNLEYFVIESSFEMSQALTL